MKRECPNLNCNRLKDPIKFGYFPRGADSKKIPRFKCKSCSITFSSATFSVNFRQKKRRLNPPIYKLFSSGCSQRRMAKILKTNLKTVARKLKFLASLCEEETKAYVESLRLTEIQFDEMETFEHTKLKPLSIPLAVEKHTRKILGIKVCEMPAKGLIAERSRKKYGKRHDHRTRAIKEMFKAVKLQPGASIESDQNPRYKMLVDKYFPDADYTQYKGRLGCVTGQGELKEGGMDPLFSLNHTCAMIRDSVKRLARRTWCTTKKKEMLQMHLNIYVHYHNFHLTK